MARKSKKPAGSEAKRHPTDTEPVVLADHGWFFVGGRYEARADGNYMTGTMYVERFVPENLRRPYPVVMFHGAGQTGTNYTGTPDGRRGWAHDFLRAGYTVYVVDQPARGRSVHTPAHVGALIQKPGGAAAIERDFTAPEVAKLWPQAERHTQWPGSGRQGDPVFDQFFASQVEMLEDRTEVERLNRDAGAALLDWIGPAIVMVHSQSGPFGWLIADARPELVKAVLSMEPNGPPFHDVTFNGGADWYGYDDQPSRGWGITRIPLTFDPPASTPEELNPVRDEESAGPDRVPGFLQAEPARKLPKLAGIPILIVAAEASYHAAYDHCTSNFLTQAGVEHELVYLQNEGLRGNGHMIMLERNNHEVADLLIAWLGEHVA
jgi:pimeloyl-ACP methyl ester carboxylesterase